MSRNIPEQEEPLRPSADSKDGASPVHPSEAEDAMERQR